MHEGGARPAFHVEARARYERVCLAGAGVEIRRADHC